MEYHDQLKEPSSCEGLEIHFANHVPYERSLRRGSDSGLFAETNIKTSTGISRETSANSITTSVVDGVEMEGENDAWNDAIAKLQEKYDVNGNPRAFSRILKEKKIKQTKEAHGLQKCTWQRKIFEEN